MIELNDFDKSICNKIIKAYNTALSKASDDKEFASEYIISVRELLRVQDATITLGEIDHMVLIALKGPKMKREWSKSDLRHKTIRKHNVAYPIIFEVIQTLYSLKRLYDLGLIVILNSSEEELQGVQEYHNHIPYFFKDENMLCFIKSFYYGVIIPTSELIYLYHNNYETTETQQYKEQYKLSQEALLIASESSKFAKKTLWITIIISSIICALSILGSYLIAKYVPTSLSDSSIECLTLNR